MKEMIRKPAIKSGALIALCFLLTSTGWLAWEYHLLDLISPARADLSTMVVGYLLQAAGIALYAAVCGRRPEAAHPLMTAALIMHTLCMFPAVLSPYPAGALIFGFLMNLFCGATAGGYLLELAKKVPAKRRATVFGVSYAAAILASWLLSVIGNGAVYYSEKVLLIAVALTAAAVAVVLRGRWGDKSHEVITSGQRHPRSFYLLVGLLVLLFSIVNSSGFAFPASDISRYVNVEFSRLVYAPGLVIAGVITDRSRRGGAVSALASLIVPFIILALRGESLSAVFFWALSYFIFGFYAVYRVIVFSDLASGRSLLFLAGAGLMAGRAGDALGEGICLLLADQLGARVAITAAVTVAAVALFFKLYQSLYLPETVHRESERERFARFAAEHDLTAREREMLQQILAERTVSEIASALFISENTVKYHVKNILQKTGCKSRNELIAVYNGRRESR